MSARPTKSRHLPKQVRLPGKEGRVSKVGRKIVREPLEDRFDVEAWRTSVDSLGAADFLLEAAPDDPPGRPDSRKFFGR
jgi:antitoxin VapB